MVILGLGTNLNDRLSFLRAAYHQIKKIPHLTIEQVSPIYISDALLPENAPESWDMPYLNLALRCDTQLTPHELLKLTKQIEIDMGRTFENRWGPRPIDIDILVWDDLLLYDDKLHVPHEHLHERPFALWPLADVAPHWVYPLKNDFYGKTAAEIAKQWGSKFSGNAPLHTQQISQRIDTPQLIGIINVTPDSFSDGGKFKTVNQFILHAQQLVKAGAEIIDIGAEATGPNAKSLSPETEWQRLEPVLNEILSQRKNFLISPKISVDTRNAVTAQKALDLGVDWINDQSAFADADMSEIIIKSQCDVVIMHQLGIPADKNNVLATTDDVTSHVLAWAKNKISTLEKSGIKRERIIFDVGIGFGKTAEQSLELIKNISQFKQLNCRLLVGHSRKSFLSLFTDKPAPLRDIETTAISLFLAQNNIDYLRIHNVEDCASSLKVLCTL
ncbi:MAG: dihydropteroate synthase [Gammaproteobacteria bacterium]|nr:dihydropteroate synthase [Gammaproteobacteria bacterium]